MEYLKKHIALLSLGAGVLIILGFSVACISETPPENKNINPKRMVLISRESDGGFNPGRSIPDNFKDLVRREAMGDSPRGRRCNGSNEFPKLTWSNTPTEAEALVLIVEGVSNDGIWVHLNAWYNKLEGGTLPNQIMKLSVEDPTALNNTNANVPAFPPVWQTGNNSWSTLAGTDQIRPSSGWSGPCPTQGSGTNTYFFKIYALNAQVSSPINQTTGSAFESTNSSQILAKGQIFGTASPPFTLTSSSDDDGFDPGGVIPNGFKDVVRRVEMGTSTRGDQCNGSNEFPKLTWANIPAGAQALVLIVEDPMGGNWVHLNAWYNKPEDGTLPNEIAKLSVEDPTTLDNTNGNIPAFPPGWQTGMNSWSTQTHENQVRPYGGWAGPCPPSGSGTHTYYFKLYALDTLVDSTAPINTMTRSVFETSATYAPQIIGQTEISGTASF